jgi:hypothetical protein
MPYLHLLPVLAHVACTRAFSLFFVDHSATFCLPAQQSPNLKIVPSPTSPFSSRLVPLRFPSRSPSSSSPPPTPPYRPWRAAAHLGTIATEAVLPHMLSLHQTGVLAKSPTSRAIPARGQNLRSSSLGPRMRYKKEDQC